MGAAAIDATGKGRSTVLVERGIALGGLAVARAKVFIDATGDAFLARSAGIPYERGYEKAGYHQPLSFRFEMGGSMWSACTAM